MENKIAIHLVFIFSLLSTSRDSTYRDDDGKDEYNTNGTLAKSSSCSSFLIDMLFRGISIRTHKHKKQKSHFKLALEFVKAFFFGYGIFCSFDWPV